MQEVEIMKRLAIGIFQMKGREDPEINLKIIEHALVEAKSRSADIVVFPEMSMGVFSREKTPSMFSPCYTNFVATISKLAQTYSIDVVSTAWEPGREKEHPYNTSLFISREGLIISSYRKLHLFDSLGFSESSYIKAGEEPPEAIEYNGIKLGLSICYDVRFPELYRYQAQKGVEVSIVSAAWYQGTLKERHLHTLLQARAIENTMFVVCADLCGRGFCGRSCAFDPYGVKILEMGEEEGMGMVYIEKTRLNEVRKKLPCLSHIKKKIFFSSSTFNNEKLIVDAP